MSITELLKNADGANINVTIGLKDLREFHAELVQDALSKQEQATKAKVDEEFISPAEACEILSVSRSTLTRWQNSSYLVPSKVGGRSKYRKAEILEILNTKRV